MNNDTKNGAPFVRRTTVALAATLTLGLALSACGAANEKAAASGGSAGLSGTLNAGGSSAQQAAVAAWTKEFQSANPEVTVNYDPVGSGGGRQQFLAGGLDFAGSDAYLSEEELSQAKQRCGGDVLELPVYVSPIAVVYHLDGVTSLNLSPKTLGGIFAGTITTWNDPAITADNPSVELPSSAITPVHRSDDSGTTENFTDYLAQAGGTSWSAGAVQTWPVKGGEGAEGTSGVISAVKNGQGTIGYADASQAGDLGTASIKVGTSFTQPSAEAAGAILDASRQHEGRPGTDLAIDVDRTSTADGVYPIVLVSYQIACADYADQAKNALVKAWLSEVTGTDGQRAAAEAAGSAPLPAGISAKVQAAIAKIAD